MSDKVRGITGCSLLFVLVAGMFDPDQGHQAIAALFGATYGGLWLQHE